MDSHDPLQPFLPPVRQWFQSTLGEPTPAQRQGWPAILAGQNTLILAPTGSGKTLAAFLACLDYLWRQDPLPRGVQVLYVSPLKALNNDIHRNLQMPLEGVAGAAGHQGLRLPQVEVAVRTGDTSTAERQRLIRQPPHVLITTPESLHLLLTSRARETLRGVRYCIVDEIHAVCANKRGVFLALLLERLQALNTSAVLRIGLSATQRPLDEVARYLGGSVLTGDGQLQPRPVTIVDAGLRKELDLRVINPVEQFGPLPERSIWPSIYRLLDDLIREHRSTIVFTNNRRTAERITAQLNQVEDLARAHHGSVALEVRQQTERALKEGRLPAVVATASLELGIDMGAVDLVCQVESPGSVARGLQRVGRAGHLVGQKSKGRLIPKTQNDLVEQAVLAREMTAGRVEEIRTPSNCLDVLAQQVVAMTAVEEWDAMALYAQVRQAYPYRDLSPQAFESVLDMVSGRYHWRSGGDARPPLAALQPRISWDRTHNRLRALPGSQQLALVNGGTIPDTGQYAAYAGGVRIGELDEEFIYERRVGDVFLLGTNAWRLENIEADRVRVVPAEGAPALVPFWRGEKTGRSFDLGLALGRFLRELAERIDRADCQSWLESEYHLDGNAARNVRAHLRRQLATGCLPTDQTVVIEAFRDPLGDWQVAFLSPLGNRLHFALRLALEGRLRQRLGYGPQCLHHDDGILLRLTDTDQPVLDLFEGLTPETVESLVLGELADSALFALRFRQNAARALLLPRARPGKRAPLWLQRLRGRDLLQVARRQPDFPIVAETFRECLRDHLDVPRLRQLLEDIRERRIQVVTQRAQGPSPFAAGLLFAFTAAHMYQYDGAEPEPSRLPSLDQELLEQLLAPEGQRHLLDPRAVHQVERRLRGVGLPPRTATEMAEWLRRLGDLAAPELEGPMAALLEQLQTDGRARRIVVPGVREPERWVLAEEEETYQRAFGADATTEEARAAAVAILGRFLQTHALVGLPDILERYPFEAEWTQRQMEEWVRTGQAVVVPTQPESPRLQWSAPENLEQVQRGTLALLRREIAPRAPAQFADFVLRWQHAHPTTRRGSRDGLAEVLGRLECLPLPAELWEETVLPARVPGYQARWLDDCVGSGEWVWCCQSEGQVGPGVLAFWRREALGQLPRPSEMSTAWSPDVENVLELLQTRGASFVSDLASQAHLAPSTVRSALWTLLRERLVTNDHFDVIRKGEETSLTATETHNRLPGRRPTLSSLRRRALQRPEGRWSLLSWGPANPEGQAVQLSEALLNRYGVVARELASLDSWMLPWRVLYEVLSKMELAGAVRRGYFVEGLSGAQFALPEAFAILQETDLPSTAGAPVVLLHSQDPANLYGSGAPFDIPLLNGGTQPFLRRAGNWLVLRAGRPVLLVEQHGRRLTALASASKADVSAAAACLPNILERNFSLGVRAKLSVEEWNNQPVITTEGKELLEAAGFVRDYQGMTLYAAWR
jgi:ATP-dependent Lhr-like helicase